MLSRIQEGIRARAGWLLPALVALVGFVPVAIALRAQTFAILGRDQGIFMYVAWALRHGERVYRDVHEINGPLPHAYYALMQVLGGEDAHVFRMLDTTWLVIAYAVASTTLPRWVGMPSSDPRTRRITSMLWGLAGLTVLGSQYVRYDWWHSAQREEMYAFLVYGSLALQAIGHTTRVRRTALVAFGLAGFLGALPWVGKPPCAVFALLQIFVLLWDRKSLVVSLRAVMIVACAAGLVVLVMALGFAFTFEDIGAGLAMLGKVTNLHHTIWNVTLLGAYRSYNNAPRLDWAFGMTLAFLAAFFVFRLPRRSLLALVLPLGGFIVFAGQGKAFPYHLHMVTLGTSVMELVILAAVVQALSSSRPALRAALPAVGVLAACALGVLSAEDALLSPSVQGHWADVGRTPEQRAMRAYREHFPFGDYFYADLYAAGAFLEHALAPEERVQTYGFDPYLLFLAKRKSATPVIYVFELNVDAALAGGPGARPTPAVRTWLEDYREGSETLVLDAVTRTPPAAFAIIDEAPFTHPKDGEEDFRAHCPRLYRFMTERYVRAAVFGVVKIWLREDVSQRRR